MPSPPMPMPLDAHAPSHALDPSLEERSPLVQHLVDLVI
jgi:hypothetical protein